MNTTVQKVISKFTDMYDEINALSSSDKILRGMKLGGEGHFLVFGIFFTLHNTGKMLDIYILSSRTRMGY